MSFTRDFRRCEGDEAGASAEIVVIVIGFGNETGGFEVLSKGEGVCRAV